MNTLPKNVKEKLCVVMPVYNEEAAIGGVLEKWSRALDTLGIDYVIRPYNDGSKDASLAVMREFARQHPEARVEVCDKPNGGHGNTILTGYREAAANGFDWIFQIDSDDEMGPEKFNELWSRRADFDFLVGIRDGRVQALPRKIISFVSRCCVRLFYGRKTVWDVNTPYRLMRVSAFKEIFRTIPLTTFAPNVILSGMVARRGLAFFETRVPQHDRTTGEVSIKKWKLMKAAMKSFWQTVLFSFTCGCRCGPVQKILLTILALAAVISLAQGLRNGIVNHIDFQWMPAKIMMDGENPYLYSLNNLPWRTWSRIDANQIPSCLLLLAPWTLLDYPVANTVWAFCNLLFIAVFVCYLYKTFFAKDAPIRLPFGFLFVALVFLAGTPLRMLVGNGQHLMFSLAFFMPALYYCLRGRPVLSGVLMALCFFKYTTVAPLLLVFIGLRAWKAIAVGAGLHILATLGMALYLHESPIVLVVQSLQTGAILTGQGTSDLASLAHSFGIPCVSTIAFTTYAVCGILALCIGWFGRRDIVWQLACLSVLSNVMFYHRGYDYVSLVFPLLFAVQRLSERRVLSKMERLIVGLIALDVMYMFFVMRVVSVPLVMPILEHILLACLVVWPFTNSCCHET